MNKHLIKIFTPQELNQSSYFQTGLYELNNDKFLESKVILSFQKRHGSVRIDGNKVYSTSQPHPKTSYYKLINKSNSKEVFFATDLYDAPNSFSKYALDNCDFIFKRNYETRYIKLLSEEYQKKIFPLGLSFRVYSSFRSNEIKFFLGLLISNIRNAIKFDSLFFRRLSNSIREVFHHWRQRNEIQELDQIKISFAGNNSILFQTRCFPHEDNEDVKEIHKQRYEICKLLMRSYGDQFMGGIIPSKLASEKYADAITKSPTDPESYLKLVRNSKIVIYTRGLDHSPAWKMAEYLAMGKVIIAEEMTTELAVPLEHGKTLLFFRNYNELIENINRVLSDNQLASTLSANARNYYEEHVHPKQNVKRIIEFMMNYKGHE